MADRASRRRYDCVEWQPGDPIWVDPREDWHNDYTHVVRYLYDLIDDDEVGRWSYTKAALTTCHRCYVAWDAAGPDGAFCWACGAKGTSPGCEPQEAA